MLSKLMVVKKPITFSMFYIQSGLIMQVLECEAKILVA
jgi:hypothetical protein